MNFYNNCVDIGYKKRKVFEKMQCTEKLFVRDKEYVWILYRKPLFFSLKGLLLYNVAQQCEETDKIVIDDMLKILYAYMIIADKQFYGVLLKTENKYQANEEKIKAKLEKLRMVVVNQKFQLPYFICEQFDLLIALINNVFEVSKAIQEKHLKIIEIVEYVGKEEVIPAKSFLDFYENINKYYVSVADMEKMYKNNEKRLNDLKIFANVFPDQLCFKHAVELLKQVPLIGDFKYYMQVPDLSELISSSFSEKVLKPYKAIVRNSGYTVEG